MLNILTLLTTAGNLPSNVSLQVVKVLSSIALQSAKPIILKGEDEKTGESFRITLEELDVERRSYKLIITYFMGTYDVKDIEITFDIKDEDYEMGLKDTFIGLNTITKEVTVLSKFNPFDYNLFQF